MGYIHAYEEINQIDIYRFRSSFEKKKVIKNDLQEKRGIKCETSLPNTIPC